VVEYGAVDGLGNPSAIASFATTVDGMPPDVRLLVGSPNATVGGVAYVDAATPLDVDPSDTGAGLASEACTVGGVARACGSPFNLSSLTGSVAIEVRAADRLGNAATRAWTFFVDPPPTAAIDVLTGPSAAPDRPVAFSGARSNDSAGIAAYAWDFGDGSRGTGLVANHSFAAPGEYVVTLAVTNLLGRTSATSVRVVVSQPQLPSELAGWVLPGYIVLATVVLFLAIMLWQRKARPRDQVASPERPEAEDEPEPKDETGDP